MAWNFAVTCTPLPPPLPRPRAMMAFSEAGSATPMPAISQFDPAVLPERLHRKRKLDTQDANNERLNKRMSLLNLGTFRSRPNGSLIHPCFISILNCESDNTMYYCRAQRVQTICPRRTGPTAPTSARPAAIYSHHHHYHPSNSGRRTHATRRHQAQSVHLQS